MVAMAYPEIWTRGEEFDSDMALVERALNQDLAAFEQLVTRYQNRIMGFVARMLNDREEAEDVTQEVFIKAYRSLDSFRGASSFSTWLYRIAQNLCIDRARKRKRSPQQAYSLDEPIDKDEDRGGREIPDLSAEPSLGVEREELRRQVRLTVAEMPEKLRSVLVMCDIQGMAYEDIARVLECPIGTVKSRLFHARADLARRLRPYVHGVK
ncbi:MAG TPA: sigma-70 family RNA polymerase sigma factor [Abditibacteriaceae bacterium]|nr:sigma-70 family RNA polymerase sigma factor [Abditibacteriaceae bacterium]